jgi:hypothetical protein
MSGAIPLLPYMHSCPEHGKFPFLSLKQGLILLLLMVEPQYSYFTKDKLLYPVTVTCAPIYRR